MILARVYGPSLWELGLIAVVGFITVVLSAGIVAFVLLLRKK